MELSATFVGVIILLLVFVPVGFMIANASGKNKKIKKQVINLSKNHGIAPTTIEIMGDTVIGLDDRNGKMIYTTRRNPSGDFTVVSMDQINDCRAKTIKHDGNSYDWVGLELVEKSGKREIQFYAETDESVVARDPLVCLQDAKRWEMSLRTLLKAS